MDRPKLALVSSLCLAVILAGCGSSSHSPSSPLQIATQSPLPPARMNVAYTTTFAAAGGVPPYFWSASNVPPGLVMSTLGTLSGTPSQSGSFMLTALVSDSNRANANGNFAISIAAPLQIPIINPTLNGGATGVSYFSLVPVLGGFQPYSFSIIQGALPAGLTVTAIYGAISGTPTGTGTSSFTVQVSDSGTPPAMVSAPLSITINPAPARSAAIYVADGGGFQIASDGSLTILPSSPEPPLYNRGSDLYMPLGVLGGSPTLPLLFTVASTTILGQHTAVEGILVNPDYSLFPYSLSTPLPTGNLCPAFTSPTVDPTGSNVYLPGCIDSNGDPGILIFPADGLLAPGPASVAIPGGQQILPGLSKVRFTPDGSQAFIASCPGSSAGSIISYSRASDGTLTTAATYTLPTGSCAAALTVSADGMYLAEGELSTSIVQVFSIGSDGSLTPASQRLVVTFDPQGTVTDVADLTWDQSGTYLIIATLDPGPALIHGGVGVLAFSENSLAETVYPMGGSVENVVRDGSFVYSKLECQGDTCMGIVGFDFQNGQLTPLPGSPWTYNPDAPYYPIVIY